MRLLFTALVVLLMASTAGATTYTYTENTNFIGPNPERGLYSKNTTPGPADFIAGTGIGTICDTAYASRTLPANIGSKDADTTILYDRFNWPTSGGIGRALNSTELSNLRANLAALRGRGCKVVFRPRFSVANQSMTTVRAMIDNFADAIADYCDVVAAVEVGFVGEFGEWHSQTDTAGTSCGTGEDCVCEAGGTTYFPRDGVTDACRSSWSSANCSCFASCNSGFCSNTVGSVACDTAEDCIGADTQSIYEYAMSNICPTGDLQRMVCFRNPRWRMIPNYADGATSTSAYDGSTVSRMCFYNDGLFTGRYDGAGTLNCQEYYGVGGGGNSGDYIEEMTAYTFTTGESSEFGNGTNSQVTGCTSSSCSMCPDSSGWDCDPQRGTSTGGTGTCTDYREPAQAIPHAADFHLSMYNDGMSASGSSCTWGADTGGAGGYNASCESMYLLNAGTYSGENGLNLFMKKLGYRYVLTTADIPATCTAGSACQISFTLRNDGFARLYNKRTAYVTFDNGTTREDVALQVDFRKKFGPGGTGSGTAETVTESVTIPSTLGVGTYTVALWLPDEADTLKYTGNGGSLTTLAQEVKHNIRFANGGSVWDAVNGYNELGSISIQSNICVGECTTGADCNDNNPCTNDLCSGCPTVCSHTNNTNNCDDGLYCTGADTCSGGSCSVHAGTPCSGPDGDSDCSETCDEATNTCTANDTDGTSCTDSTYCNGTDTCLSGSCATHTGDPCSVNLGDADSDCSEACNEAADDCTSNDANGSACDDGAWCTENDSCTTGTCDGDAKDCSTSLESCKTGTCDEGTDACIAGSNKADGTVCTDNVYCNGADECSSGDCSVHDGDPCIGTANPVCSESTDTCGTATTGQGVICQSCSCQGCSFK